MYLLDFVKEYEWYLKGLPKFESNSYHPNVEREKVYLIITVGFSRRQTKEFEPPKLA